MSAMHLGKMTHYTVLTMAEKMYKL